MSLMPPDRSPDWEYEADPLGRLGQGQWRRKPFMTDTWSEEDDDSDPDVAEMRRAFRAGELFDIHDETGRVKLDQAVGRNQPNTRADVARVEVALHRAGFYDLESTGGPTGWYGPPQDEAIKAYQKAGGFDPDGVLLHGGPTATSLGENTRRALGVATQNTSKPWVDENDVRHAPANQVAVAPAAAVAVPIIESAPIWGPVAHAAVGSALGFLGSVGKGWIDEQLRQGRDLGQFESDARSPFFPKSKSQSLLDLEIKERREVMRPGATILPGGLIQEAKPGIFVTPQPNPLPPIPPSSLPKDTKPEDWVEVYPDQSEQYARLLPVIIPRYGSEETKNLNTEVAECLQKAAGDDFSISGGGYGPQDESGKRTYRRETWLRPEGKPPGTLKDGSFVDVTLETKGGGRILVNTTDTYADGVNETGRERDAAIRIIRNKKANDILILIPKLKEGQTLNCDALAEFSKPYINQVKNGVGFQDILRPIRR